jgi:hypothetical protein
LSVKQWEVGEKLRTDLRLSITVTLENIGKTSAKLHAYLFECALLPHAPERFDPAPLLKRKVTIKGTELPQGEKIQWSRFSPPISSDEQNRLMGRSGSPLVLYVAVYVEMKSPLWRKRKFISEAVYVVSKNQFRVVTGVDRLYNEYRK